MFFRRSVLFACLLMFGIISCSPEQTSDNVPTASGSPSISPNANKTPNACSSFVCRAQTCTVCGTSASETVNGTSGNDVICGLGGNDTLYGNGGADLICGSTDADTIYGGSGSDELYGNNGNDYLIGDGGSDYCNGGPDTTGDSCDCETTDFCE